MKGKPINRNTTIAALSALAAVLAAGFFMWWNYQPPKMDLSKLSKEELEDRDPPHPGQKGYRERITDPPAP